MSLKTIGKLGESSKLLNSLTKGSSGWDKAFYTIRDSLDGLNVEQASKKLKDLELNPTLASDILTAANRSEMLVGSTDEIADGLKKINAEGKNVGTLGNAFTGLGAITVPLLPIILGIVTAKGALAISDIPLHTLDT